MVPSSGGNWQRKPGYYDIWGDKTFAICGDDLIAIWNDQRIKSYEKIVQDCGGRFSKGKHLCSTKYGIFTEEVFQFHRVKKVAVGRSAEMIEASALSPD